MLGRGEPQITSLSPSEWTNGIAAEVMNVDRLGKR